MPIKSFSKFIKNRVLESDETQEVGYFPKPDDWSGDVRWGNVYGITDEPDEPEEVTIESLNSKIANLESIVSKLSMRIDELDSKQE
jgi:hypothetical protein